MTTDKGKALIVILGLAIAFLASACGTLQVSTEPTAAPLGVEVKESTENSTAAPTEIVKPAPTEQVGELAMDSETPAEADGVDVATGDRPAEMQQYTNNDYGFSLSYPAGWSLAELTDAGFAGPGSRSVQLSQGTVKLIIGYRRAGEQTAIGGSGVPAGDFETRGTVQVAGQDVERMVLVYEGRDKAVMYGLPGAPIAAGGLEFALTVEDFAQVDYGAIELPQQVQADADFIASSLAIIEAEGAGASAAAGGETMTAAGYDYSGWQSYTNETVGYALMAPGNTDVMGADRDKAVEFVGPIAGDDHWPWFMVQHFDSAFFRPPAGTDVRQWIAGSDIAYKAEAQEATIGGLPAVHFQMAPSPQAYGMDEYYVIAGEQLFKITILHAGGLEDWALYEQFLASITFLG
jgi:hypothetical protein